MVARFLIPIFVLAFSASLTFAADLPRAPIVKGQPVVAPFSRSGPYVGLHIGYGWGKKEWTDVGSGVFNGDIDYDGFLAGGQIGWNYQNGNWVWGLEGDLSWTDMDGRETIAAGDGTLGISANWLATLTGRSGLAQDRTLYYIKGGAAWINEDLSFSSIALAASGGRDLTRHG